MNNALPLVDRRDSQVFRRERGVIQCVPLSESVETIGDVIEFKVSEDFVKGDLLQIESSPFNIM